MNPKSVICCEPEIVPSELPPAGVSSNVVTLPSIEDENEPVNVFKDVLSISNPSMVVTLLSIEPVNVLSADISVTAPPDIVTVTSPLPSSVTSPPSNVILVTPSTSSPVSEFTFKEAGVAIVTVVSPLPSSVTVAPLNVIESTEDTVVIPSSTDNAAALIVTVTSPFKSSVTVAPLKEMLSTPLTLPTCKVYADGKEPLRTPSTFNLSFTLASV